jgi:hypothetical protein
MKRIILEVGQYITIYNINGAHHCKIVEINDGRVITKLPDGRLDDWWFINADRTSIPGCEWELLGIDDDFQFELLA